MTEPFLMIVIEALLTVLIVLNGFAIATVWERKLLGRFQARYGPNRAGPVGYMQPIADLLKLVFKEDFVPGGREPAVVPDRAIGLGRHGGDGDRDDSVW